MSGRATITWSFLKVWQIGVERLGGVAGLPFGQRLHGQRHRGAMQQRVAVGLGARHLSGAEDAAARPACSARRNAGRAAPTCCLPGLGPGCRPTRPAWRGRPIRRCGPDSPDAAALPARPKLAAAIAAMMVRRLVIASLPLEIDDSGRGFRLLARPDEAGRRATCDQEGFCSGRDRLYSVLSGGSPVCRPTRLKPKSSPSPC